MERLQHIDITQHFFITMSFISREVESQAARRLECVSGSMNSTWSLEPGPAQHVVVGASVSHQASSVRRDDG